MKRLIVIMAVLAIGLFLSNVPNASAVEVKVGGQFEIGFFITDKAGTPNGTFADIENGGNTHEFIARQRVRTWFDFIMSENLKGQLYFEIGETNWGNVGEHTAAGSGFSLNGDGVSIEVRRAFIDWIVPNTKLKVRMGLQGIAMPMALGQNVVFDDDQAGIMLSYSFNDMVSSNLFWSRPYDNTMGDAYSMSGEGTKSKDDEMDIFGLIVPIKGVGWSITPWGAYANIGGDIPVSSTKKNYINGGSSGPYYAPRDLRILGADYDYAWWLGTAVTVTALDPFVIKFDGIYGALHHEKDNDRMGTNGYWLGAAVDYKASWGTPGIFGWYGSGDGAGDNDRGQIAQLWTSGSSLLGFAFDGTNIGPRGGGRVLNKGGVGLWGVGLQVKDISFVDKLTHMVRVAYIQGTNDKDARPWTATTKNADGSFRGSSYQERSARYMTTEDWAIEIDVHTTYAIYDNLTAYLELGYLIPDFGSGRNSKGQKYSSIYDENAFKCALGLKYSF
jgi:hypothetical protein